MAATYNLHRFQCRHQAGHRFRGADLCTRASRGYTVSTKRLALGKQFARLRRSYASSDAADAQLARMVRIVFEWACTFNATVTRLMGSATLPVVTFLFAMALACLYKEIMRHITRSNRVHSIAQHWPCPAPANSSSMHSRVVVPPKRLSNPEST